MTEEQNNEAREEKQTRNTDKKRIEALESHVAGLSESVESVVNANLELAKKLSELTEAIRKSAHVMGWPRDLLEKHGIKAFDKTTESLRN